MTISDQILNDKNRHIAIIFVVGFGFLTEIQSILLEEQRRNHYTAFKNKQKKTIKLKML